MHATSGSGIGNVTDSSALVEMAMGYARSRVLCAAARLGIADLLGDNGKNVDQLASECGADAGSLYRLLRARASFGIVTEIAPQRFTLTRKGGPLRKAASDSAWPAIIFWADLLADQWSFLTECIKKGDLNMLVVTGGKERTATTWKVLLTIAGFEIQNIIPVPRQSVSIIEALAPHPHKGVVG